MNDPQIALAYCIDNIRFAEEVDSRISKHSSYRFKHVYCKESTSDASIGERLKDFEGPILLVLSDNFLKSAQCMSKGLSFLQAKGEQVLPIVVSGYSTDHETGEVKKIETNFERVSDIIQYINYWQDQYLDLRRQKRQIKDLDEVSFNAHLKIMREISSEAGEFLRLLRNMNYVSESTFKAQHLKHFFEFVDDLGTWEQFQHNDLEVSAAEPEEAMNASTEPDISGDSSLGEPDSSIDPASVSDEVEASPESDDVIETEAPDELVPEMEGDPMERIEALLAQANKLAQDGDHDKSLSVLREASEAFPNNVGLKYEYALSLAQKQEYQEQALGQLQQILDLDPANIDAKFLIGELAEVNGDFDKALEAYQELAQLAPTHNDIYYRIGILISDHFPEKAPKAGEAFLKAIEHHPENTDTHYQYALLLNETLGRSEEAIKHFKEVLVLQADHPFANYDLALIYHGQGNSELAREYYLKAAETNPELKTEENDLAFQLDSLPTEQETEESTPEEVSSTPIELSPSIKEEEVAEETEAEEQIEAPMIESTIDDLIEDAPLPEEEAIEAPAPEQVLEEEIILLEGSGNGAEEKEAEPENPLDALKENIRRLEEMFQAQATAAAEAEAEAAVEPEAAPLIGSGKIVMITGATSAIGKTVAQTFAEQGYRLILSDRDAEKVGQLEATLKEHHEVEIIPLPLDLRNISEIEAAFQNKLDFDWRQVDVLVNCAVKSSIGFDAFYKSRLDLWEELIDVNLKGALYIIRAVIQYMVKRHQGHIINVETRNNEADQKRDSAKQLFSTFVEMLRQEVSKNNIRISTISLNQLVLKANDEVGQEEDNLASRISPRDVAEAIAYAASCPPHLNIPRIELEAMRANDPGFISIGNSGTSTMLHNKINPFS